MPTLLVSQTDVGLVSAPDLLRPSRDGDQFHYMWAARQSLRLLDETAGLDSLFVEAVDPSEQTPVPLNGTVTPVADINTGDEVIDLAEYWGSSDIAETDRVVYRQFKHSTRSPDTPWTLSFLTKTLIGFAHKYKWLTTNHPGVMDRVVFEFISNRPPADSALVALNDLRTGSPSSATKAIRKNLATIISDAEIAHLCGILVVDERAPSLLRLRHLLAVEVADLLPGAPGEQALLLREMISSRATSIAGANPAVRRADVLVALKTSDDQLLPAPNLIEPPMRPIDRHQFAEIAAKVQEGSSATTLVHGSGGVGKSVLAWALERHLPTGSIAIVFDCFGNGSYRRASAPRHRPKQGFVQLVNELAGHALCDPIIPSATADDADYAVAFIRKLAKAAETLATTTPTALLTIVIDAADNAAMIADEMGERSFIRGLVREALPNNVRLVVTCRTERIDLLGLPADYQDIPLHGFDLDETSAHIHTTYPLTSRADVSEFHARTSHNPRVQAAVLDATSTLEEALAWLAPNPVSPGQALDTLIERQVSEIRDRQHESASDIDAICVGLAALRPMIPVRVLAELASVHASVVLSFVSDLGRPLLVDGDSVQFRDEPTETWFRGRYRPQGADLDSFIDRLAPIADQDAYVAASLPALLFEANRFDDLVKLALSDDHLPDSALPTSQRNEIQRREIAQQRTHFALAAALRADRDLEAAQLALRLGALTAGRTRRLELIRGNTDLAAQFLDASVLEQLIATRSLKADWPNSNLPIEGALLAGAAGQTDQARNRLRSAISWMHAWVRQSRSDGTKSGLGQLDILQVTWGLLNTDGPKACIKFLRRWKPRALAFDVGVEIARRLLDAGRLTDFRELARAARGRHLKLAIAQACAERDLVMDPEIVAHLIRPLLTRTERVQPSLHDDYRRSASADPLHDGMTAAIWLISNAVTHKIVDPVSAARILQIYLPENLGHRTGSWHDRDVWQYILGLVLRARIDGRTAEAVDIQGPQIRDAREREKIGATPELRAYRANVEPLVSWAVAWLDLALSPDAKTQRNFAQLATEFLQESPPRWREEQIDQTKINTALILIGRALARYPAIVDHALILDFQARNNDVITRRTVTNFIRQTASQPLTQRLSAELAKRCHEDAKNAREDAAELASDFVQLARATHRISPVEASVHFQAALDITNAIGDDAWTRWETLIGIATAAGKGLSDQPGRAYRLTQIAESLEPYLGDYLSHDGVLSTAAGLSLSESLAAGSRWRDRRVASIRNLANGISTDPTLLLSSDPISALILLPLGSQYPDHRVLAAAIATGSYDPRTVLVTYLQIRRPYPLEKDELNELLTLTGVTETDIKHVDPSLLWTSTREANRFTSHASSQESPKLSFADLDLTTVTGWAAALERGSLDHSATEVFEYAATLIGTAPEILHAFSSCPTTSQWDFSRLLESLQGQSLSMATQAALDEVAASQIGRFASDLLLVSWRTHDFDAVRSLTGRDTDYEHIASRALAEQQTFTAEQAYALALHLSRRLSVDHALQLFDAAASYFNDTAPLNAHDGNHSANGIAGNWDTESAIAAVIWAALGDPAGKTRWQAAHSVHLALTLGHAEVVSHLLDLASGRLDPGPFLDPRLEFYGRHAMQWLLYGINRATVEPAALATAARCENFLKQVVTGTPHAVNTPLARDSLLRLHTAGIISLETLEKKDIEQIASPIGVSRNDRKTGLEDILCLAELEDILCLAELTEPDTVSAATQASAVDASDPRPDMVTTTPEVEDEDAEDQRFRFFYDFRQYWCNPLGDAFGISDSSVERLVTELLVDEWSVSSKGRPEDDMRHTLKLYPRDNYASHGEWPKEEDLDFYLAFQGLCEVAGILLKSRPTIQEYDEDEETGESEYTRFLQRHMPTRQDGRWLADRRDPPPPNAQIYTNDPNGLGTSGRDSSWIYSIPSDRFIQEMFRSSKQVVVEEFRSVNHYDQNEIVSINSALVTPRTAPALLNALQTSPDKHAFRIPDTNDEDYSSTVPGFELTGWIEPYGHSYGLDRQDPTAKSIDYPPIRPTHSLPSLENLVPDPDMRLWSDGQDVVIVSTVWDDYSDERQTTGSSGHTLVVNRTWLATTLQKLDRWLLLEVEVQRRWNNSSRGSSRKNEDEHIDMLPPYTKYFLIDTTGEVHEYHP